jgi:hypothetical protein
MELARNVLFDFWYAPGRRLLTFRPGVELGLLVYFFLGSTELRFTCGTTFRHVCFEDVVATAYALTLLAT